ncbi:uncharacterized protein LOC133812926 [Humulus lupulus]|uniref:uncharacterized protein LOC133812926 n=1 Tax=Humulus lupulus TaxID=3486 RepID=UPI002B40534E|nr:uncharacterized protein LOC133812926 [Humulus lupulus]
MKEFKGSEENVALREMIVPIAREAQEPARARAVMGTKSCIGCFELLYLGNNELFLVLLVAEKCLKKSISPMICTHGCADPLPLGSFHVAGMLALIWPATAFKGAYESLGLDASGGKSVHFQKIWHLIQALTGEDSSVPKSVSKKMSLIIGARRHLERGHGKYVMDTIQSHPAQGTCYFDVHDYSHYRLHLVGLLETCKEFIRLRDYGVLEFDAGCLGINFLAYWSLHFTSNYTSLLIPNCSEFFFYKLQIWNDVLGSSSCNLLHKAAGFYICWGCLVWVPSIYTSPGMYLVNHPVHLGTQLALYILVAGILCIYINYDCDRQRQEFCRTNGKALVWGKAPSKITATYTTTTGETKSSILLTSGWWGLARHFHYVPEILAAFFWTVPALFNHALPYFYVVFLTILLLDRAKRDDDRCRSKYGKYWKSYCEKVRYRVIPGIY